MRYWLKLALTIFLLAMLYTFTHSAYHGLQRMAQLHHVTIYEAFFSLLYVAWPFIASTFFMFGMLFRMVWSKVPDHTDDPVDEEVLHVPSVKK